MAGRMAGGMAGMAGRMAEEESGEAGGGGRGRGGESAVSVVLKLPKRKKNGQGFAPKSSSRGTAARPGIEDDEGTGPGGSGGDAGAAGPAARSGPRPSSPRRPMQVHAAAAEESIGERWGSAAEAAARAMTANAACTRRSSRKGDLAALRSAVRDTRVCMQRLRAGGSLDKGSSPSWRAAAREAKAAAAGIARNRPK